MGTALAVAGAREEPSERERAERDDFRVEAGARQQLEMAPQFFLARKGCDYETVRVLPAHAREGHRSVVDGERQVFLQRERHGLLQLAAIAEGQREQPLRDELAG